MGAGLVKAAYRAAASVNLPHAPARLFVFMALVALDGDRTPAYFGGREKLAEALGKPQTDAGYRAVGRAVESLVKQHKLIGVTRGGPGHKARYALLNASGEPLRAVQDTGRSASGDEEARDAHRPVNTGRSAHEHRSVSAQTHDAHRPAEEKEEIQEEGGARSAHTPAPLDSESGSGRGAAGAVRLAPQAVASRGAETGVGAARAGGAGSVHETAEPPMFCARHPRGTDDPCRACGDARRAYTAWERSHPQTTRTAAAASLMVTVQPGERHPGRPHVLVGDGTTCALCDWRADHDEPALAGQPERETA